MAIHGDGIVDRLQRAKRDHGRLAALGDYLGACRELTGRCGLRKDGSDGVCLLAKGQIAAGQDHSGYEPEAGKRNAY
jgi:hypothetical protein